MTDDETELVRRLFGTPRTPDPDNPPDEPTEPDEPTDLSAITRLFNN